jgi:membrane associated rhomboid family serine protease
MNTGFNPIVRGNRNSQTFDEIKKNWLADTPIVTFIMEIACMVPFLIKVLEIPILPEVYTVCMLPREGFVLSRVLLNPFFHLSFPHILFNMISFHTYAVKKENELGTRPFAALMLYYIIGGAIINLFIVFFAMNVLSVPKFMNECSVGLSGVVFALLTNYCFDPNSRGQYKAIFGFKVSVLHYPISLLIITQMLIREASFIGHLSGVCVAAIPASVQVFPKLKILFKRYYTKLRY